MRQYERRVNSVNGVVHNDPDDVTTWEEGKHFEEARARMSLVHQIAGTTMSAADERRLDRELKIVELHIRMADYLKSCH